MAPSILRTLLTALLLITQATTLTLPNLNSLLPARITDANPVAVGTTARSDIPSSAVASDIPNAPLPHGWYGHDATLDLHKPKPKIKRTGVPPRIAELRALASQAKQKAKRAPAPLPAPEAEAEAKAKAEPDDHPIPHGWYGYAATDTKSQAHDHELTDADADASSSSSSWPVRRRSPLDSVPVPEAVGGAKFQHEAARLGKGKESRKTKREASAAAAVNAADAERVEKYREFGRARDALTLEGGSEGTSEGTSEITSESESAKSQKANSKKDKDKDKAKGKGKGKGNTDEGKKGARSDAAAWGPGGLGAARDSFVKMVKRTANADAGAGACENGEKC